MSGLHKPRLTDTALLLSLVFREATLTLGESHQTAYQRARHIERFDRWPERLPPPFETTSTRNMKWPEKLEPKAAGRLLGYMLIEAYNQEGADTIARDINSCGNGQSQEHAGYELANFARFYSLTLMKTCTSINFYCT